MLYLVAVTRPVEHAMVSLLDNLEHKQMHVDITKLQKDDVQKVIDENKPNVQMYFPVFEDNWKHPNAQACNLAAKLFSEAFGIERNPVNCEFTLDFSYNLFTKLLKFPTDFSYKIDDIIIYVEYFAINAEQTDFKFKFYKIKMSY